MAKRITKTYDQEFKSQAVKLAQEIGGYKAAEELGVSEVLFIHGSRLSKKDDWQQKQLFILQVMP